MGIRKWRYNLSLVILPVIFICSLLFSCKKESAKNNGGGTDTTVVVSPTTFDINSINDTYEDVAPFASYMKWGSYNVHDPSIKKFGDNYYCYSTDVGYGIDVRG